MSGNVQLPPIRTATEIMATEYADPTFIVDRVIPDSGLIILAGPKASGKTQALLSIAAGVSAGGYALGNLQCEQGSVLYIQLELSERKVHQRMHRMQLTNVDNIHFPHASKETRIPTWRIGGEGVRDIRLAIERYGYRLVIVDVFQKIWPEHLDLNSYADAYKVLGALREIANDTGTAIVLATHFRKQESEDISDRIMGSVGIVGNADVVLTIQRQRGTMEGVLSGFGNDIADVNLSMRFDPVTTAWTITDAPPEETLLTPERRKILNYLREHGPLSLQDLSDGVKKSTSTVSNQLKKLKKSGLVTSLAYGIWTINNESSPTPDESGESSESSPRGDRQDSSLSSLSPTPQRGDSQPDQEPYLEDLY